MPTATDSGRKTRLTEWFAWQGFAFEHPADFAPLALTGDRAEGYVRLGSTGNVNYQIRWKDAKKAGDLQPKLSTYLNRLEKDAKKAKTKFKSDIDREDGVLVYRYTGAGQGRGRLFHDAVCSRVYFLEVVGLKKDMLLPHFRNLSASFRSTPKGEPERWSLLGLNIQVPGRMSVEKKVFQAGKTHLVLRCPKAKVEAVRWGFGKQLIDKHGFEPWARAALGLKAPADEASDCRLAFTARNVLRTSHTRVWFNEDENQIVTLQVTTRNRDWRPDWDWFS